MRKVLVTWIGKTDLRAITESNTLGLGPIAQALTTRSFEEAYLATDYPEDEVRPFLRWLKQKTATALHVLNEPLSGPTNFGEIYEAARRACLKALEGVGDGTDLTFHLSPGTPAMAAVWVILAKTRFPAELIESSREQGVRTASVPFDISADFIPDLLREQDEKLRRLGGGETPEAPEFAEILHRSRVMDRLIQRARKVAVRKIPVLLEGESGTGKEMLGRAIHHANPWRDGPFIAVNCGAIPAELVESELFGHEKGAFTGALLAREGYFEAASGGTLFLDEIGELPSAAQVKLLRVLQESEVVRLGSTKPLKVDVRIVGATNRTLTKEIAEGRFREDLFYRLAVVLLRVPALRERPADVGILVDHFMEYINGEASSEPGFKPKKISAGGRDVLLSHSWPGNVRELMNTLQRAVVWAESATVTAEDIREALIPVAARRTEILGRPLGGGFSLPTLIEEVARHYLGRALDESHGNKTEAAALVGLSSYQTLTNWIQKYQVSYGGKSA